MPMGHKELGQLPIEKRAELIQAYKDFFQAIDEEQPETQVETVRLFLRFNLISSAYADGPYNCVYSGWPSQKINGRCTNPARTNSSYSSFASNCTGQSIVCQPMLFGVPVLCASTATQAKRNSSFAQCESQAKSQGRTNEVVAQGLADASMAAAADELFQTVDRICTTGFQSKTGMCRNLEKRVADIRSEVPTPVSTATASATTAPKQTDEEPVQPVTARSQDNISDDFIAGINLLTNGTAVESELITNQRCAPSIEARVQPTPVPRASRRRGPSSTATLNRLVVQRNPAIPVILCPRAPQDAPVGDYSRMISDYNISFHPSRSSIENTPAFRDFMFELSKFPPQLMREMAARNGAIRVIVGNRGIESDPQRAVECQREIDLRRRTVAYYREDRNGAIPPGRTEEQIRHDCSITFDGRSRSSTSGSGGMFSVPSFIIPTRIVINELYEKPSETNPRTTVLQGTTNLTLHEHAHALDNLYRAGGISSSPAWTRVIRDSQTNSYLRNILSTYEYNNAEEGFAELFTYYHSCAEARNQIQTHAPQLYQFLQNLTTTAPYR